MRSWFGFLRFALRGALPPKLGLCDSSQLSPLRLAVCLVGQRALLNADMLQLIDQSACLVEPVAVESCASPPVLVLSPAASTSSAASGRCSRMSFPRGLVEGLLLPESSLRAAFVASLRLLLLDDRDLSLFCHVVDIMCFLTDLLCFVFLLPNCERCHGVVVILLLRICQVLWSFHSATNDATLSSRSAVAVAIRSFAFRTSIS